MKTWNISSRATGLDFGNYSGKNIAQALQAFAVDAGYHSYADLCAAIDERLDVGDMTNDLRIVEVV